MFKQDFIAVDWGTTNRRAYRVNKEGKHDAEFEDERGVLSVGPGDFPPAVAEIRERLGDLPMLLAGMVGSNRGWVEAPYVRCPGGCDELAAGLVWVEPERCAIVPGLYYLDSDRADVMRGEEVQMLGAVHDGLLPSDGLACHPGTHNKWVTLNGGAIQSFRTVMTGELYNLLKSKSILSDWLQASVETDASFAAGVRQGLKGKAMGAELFTVRARILVGQSRAEDAASFTSGLLIGSDLSSGLEDSTSTVTVIGRPELTRLYAAAITETGREPKEVDGEDAFIAGIAQIARRVKC